jgi:tetratricopeptide (TPR) repeat protein
MPPAGTSRNVFISHTHADKDIADAFRDLVADLFGTYVTVSYSTGAEHGPKHGARWLQWIHDQVGESDFTLVLLTPASLQKPWILWEAGAVSGTAVASGASDGRKVRPLVFRVPPEQVPDPFREVQLVRGDSFGDVESVLLEWMEALPGAAGAKAGKKLETTVRKYLAVVETALDQAPLVPTEGVVQEWCIRLDELRAQNRMSEVKTVHDWLNVAFGRDCEDKPLDLRLHRRLGELYLNARQYPEAAVQFELARQLSPRDILILRELGRAYLGAERYEKTAEVVAAIDKLDPRAFERNVECAALKGRMLRKTDPAGACEVYQKAFANNPSSYYAGDLLGQMQLQLGREDAARATYRRVLEIVNGLDERNLWIQATAANAAIVANAEAAVVRKKLEGIREFAPSPENLRTIEDGLRRVQSALGIEESVVKEWLATLRQ